MRLSCARPLLRLLYVQLRRPLTGRGLVRRLMHDQQKLQNDHTTAPPAPNGATPAPAPESAQQPNTHANQPAQPEQAPKPPRLLLLVRHGQTTFNVESRLPGQIPGVPLTDEGRRQAQRAAVALSGLPLSAVVSSPLERARETAEILARGWALPVRTDPRLVDTDVGPWAGQKIADLKKSDPRWEQFVQNPFAPPEGIEGFAAVQQRVVAAVQDIIAGPELGSYIVLVGHADVIKLILAHYTSMAGECARFVTVANASISVLAFPPDQPPHLLAVNWTVLPGWLSPPPVPQQPAPEVAQAQAPSSGVPEPPETREAPASASPLSATSSGSS